jgi:hypothetical protein
MIAAGIEARVIARAGNRCEYCQMHQSLQGASFHLEHVVPRSKAGESTWENLALACPGCNFKKSDHVDGRDPQSGQIVPLFHPRNDTWTAHFAWRDVTVTGLTPAGRATIDLLDLNHPRRLAIRSAEKAFGLFPP